MANFWLRYNPVIESFDNVNFTQIPVVSYCDLISNPRKYDGKVIVLKGAILRKNDHGYIFSGEYCSDEGINAITSVNFYKPKREEIFNKYNLESLSDSFQPKAIELIANGRFTYKDHLGNSDAMRDIKYLQFEIYHIGLFSPLMDSF